VPSRFLGRQIGRYQVTRLLGGGAFSWVYEAVDRELRIPVALKVLRPDVAALEGAELRFRREATTAARLRHPHIVTVRDVGLVDGIAFVAMDLFPLTLARRLQVVPRLPEPDVVRLGLEIAGALAIAHAEGVVHRDIKPDNILLGHQGEAVVADFGLALVRGSAGEATGLVQGTPHYFSPEQARGATADARSDLYSLGVLLFRASTGRLPFEGDDWQDVARQHLEHEAPSVHQWVPELSTPFAALVQRLLAKDPEDRFPSATSLIDALAQLPSAPPARPLGPAEGTADATIVVAATAPSSRRRPATARRALLATLLTAVLAIAGWQTWRNLPRPRPAVAGDTLPSAPARPDTGTATVANADTAPARPGDTRQPLGTSAPAPNGRPSARLVVTTAESATLRVGDRTVGTGRWEGPVQPAARVRIAAALPDALEGCPWAARDTVMTLRAGVSYAVALPVRDCGELSVEVDRDQARIDVRGLDAGPALSLRPPSARGVVVPIGRYAVDVTAPGCRPFRDTVTVTGPGTPPLRARLWCD
jgi:serine/threonine-protein kinase